MTHFPTTTLHRPRSAAQQQACKVNLLFAAQVAWPCCYRCRESLEIPTTLLRQPPEIQAGQAELRRPGAGLLDPKGRHGRPDPRFRTVHRPAHTPRRIIQPPSKGVKFTCPRMFYNCNMMD